MMRKLFPRTVLVLSMALCASLSARAEPLLSRGIGTATCSGLAADIKPNEGLNDPINLMVYAWVQGYVSAANVALLEYDKRYVDMTELTDTNVLHLIREYCKAHPERKPSNALDAYLKNTAKLRAQWQAGTIEWDQ